MFCYAHTDKWTADTGFIGHDNQDQEVENLSNELKNLLSTEVEAIIAKLSRHQKLMDVIKKSVLHQLTISIEADHLGESENSEAVETV